jgi:hypothetical protein
MVVVVGILAQRLARDNMWPVLVLLLTLAVMAGIRTLGNRLTEYRETRHRLHELHRSPPEPVSHERQ